MQLAPGDRLGTFQIEAKLGEGGMGVVYRAHDAKLGRDVAIKILPDAFLKDPDRLARFEREARALAALNHPNVAQIFDFVSTAADAAGSAPAAYLVMELVDGDDLSVVIQRGAVPIPEAVAIAQQIASALGAAHELGIIHRDLKPANIKVRADGTVKVLDFGLAKALDPVTGAASGSLANSPTMTSPATELGMILGTAAYMSPEQARGKAVDRRADVWAFGVVLYEMLTGRRAFSGSEVSDVLASVLKDQLAWSELPAETPVAMRRLLRRCLEKDRTQRLDSMTAARLELADAAAGGGADAAALHIVSDSASLLSLRRVAIGGVVLLAAGLAIGAFAAPRFWSAAPANAGRVVELTIPSSDANPMGVAITPSGDTIVFESDRVYVREISGSSTRPIAGTEGARNVFMSSNGKWVGFFAGGKLKRVALTGGDTLSLATVDSDTPGGASGPDNTVLYSPGWNSALYSVSADGGGTPKAVSTIDAAAGELGHWWPDLLPDGKTVLFTIWTSGSGINDSRLGLLDLATGKHRVLMNGGAFGRYSRSGHLVYFHAGDYHVVPFDASSLALGSESQKLDLGIVPHHPLGTRQKTFAISADGTLVFLAGRINIDDKLSWVTPTGGIEPLAIPPLAFDAADLSPDGRVLLISASATGTFSIYRHDLQRGTSRRIDLPGSNFAPAWSPTGTFFAFTTLRSGHFDVNLFRLDDDREAPVITEPLDQNVSAVLRDGKRLLIQDYRSDGSIAFSLADIDRPKDRQSLRLPGEVEGVAVSPDDKWLAIETAPSGRREISVTSLGTPGPVVQVSTQGGHAPVWSKTKPKLYYRRDDGIVSVTYSTVGGRFTAEREELLARVAKSYAIGEAPDGRVLIGTNVPGQSNVVHAIVNWFQTIKK